MDVTAMLGVWKKGAPMKARMGAMFGKAKNLGMLMRRGLVQPTELTVDIGDGGGGDGPMCPPGSGKRLGGAFGNVSTAHMLGRSPGSKYAEQPSSTRSLKGVFGQVKTADSLANSLASPAKSKGGGVEAWGESPSANAAPGEMRDGKRAISISI